MRGAADELREFGSTVLRGVWTPAQLQPLRAAIVEFLQARAARVAAGAAAAGDVLQHQHGAGTVAMMEGGGFTDTGLIVDLFRGSDYHRLCAEFLADDAFYAQTSRLAFRHHDPRRAARTFVPFHQDSGSQDWNIRDVLNCWIPLDPGCGRDAPGLQVVRRPSEPDFPLRVPEQTENLVYDRITIDADRVAEEFAGELMAPEFEVGDALVFSEHVIHRTYVTPQMTRPRLNFEFRVFSPKHLNPVVAPEIYTAAALRLA